MEVEKVGEIVPLSADPPQLLPRWVEDNVGRPRGVGQLALVARARRDGVLFGGGFGAALAESARLRAAIYVAIIADGG